MSKPIDIDSRRPHRTAFCICECGYKWQAVFPVGAAELECAECGKMTHWEILANEGRGDLKVLAESMAGPQPNEEWRKDAVQRMGVGYLRLLNQVEQLQAQVDRYETALKKLSKFHPARKALQDKP